MWCSESKPVILTAGSMWQSPLWLEVSTNVFSEEERKIGVNTLKETVRRLFRQRKNADIVCTSGGGVNFWYAFYNHFFSLPKNRVPQIANENFLPEPNPKSILWQFKRLLRRIVFSTTDAFIVYTEPERKLWAEYLNLPIERFHTLLFHTNIQEPHWTPVGNYGFAAGRSERDYCTFFEAVRNLDARFVVVADPKSVDGLTVPDNVELHCNISYQQYLNLLEKAAFTVVPLQIRQRSTGQVVVLEGYGLGKPTIVTRCLGIDGYLRENETGFFCEPYDSASLREKIEIYLHSPSLIEQHGHAALDWTLKEFTFDAFVEKELNIINNVWKHSLSKTKNRNHFHS
ncbi:MAG: glycosyltransferase [Planctomycetaceae bacterium]|jgi:glycosyltransferase involved in cell wall biosynthesis|nr:glycosyltransferase [Planctomycetaceae bacterium]